MGPKSVLNQEEEDLLCDYIHQMLDWIHPVTPLQLKNKVQAHLLKMECLDNLA